MFRSRRRSRSALVLRRWRPPLRRPRHRSPRPAAQAPQTRAALLQGLDTAFKTIDANGDGSSAPPSPAPPKARSSSSSSRAGRARIEAEFTKLDTNKDGQLSKAEFMAAAPPAPATAPNGAAIVAQLDKNKDGKVTADEYRAPRLVRSISSTPTTTARISAAERQAAIASRTKK